MLDLNSTPSALAMFSSRPALKEDIEQILAIDPSSWSRRASLTFTIDQGECYVVGKERVVFGYGIMDHRFVGRGFVHHIYVDAARRRLRVASRLFNTFEEPCKSTRIFTSTNLSNLPMQGLLASKGYVLSGVVQHLDEGDPELFFSKRLK